MRIIEIGSNSITHIKDSKVPCAHFTQKSPTYPALGGHAVVVFCILSKEVTEGSETDSGNTSHGSGLQVGSTVVVVVSGTGSLRVGA